MTTPQPPPGQQTPEAPPTPAAEEHASMLVEWRNRLHEITLLIACATMMILSWSALSVAGDIHAARVDQVESGAAGKAVIFAKIDEFLGVSKQFLVILRVLESRLDTQLTQVRSQVQQSSEDSNKTAQKAIAAAADAVSQTSEKADQVISAVQDNKPLAPVVHVEAPKPPDMPPVIVSPVIPAPPPLENPTAEPPPQRRGFGQWLKKVFSFSKKKD